MTFRERERRAGPLLIAIITRQWYPAAYRSMTFRERERRAGPLLIAIITRQWYPAASRGVRACATTSRCAEPTTGFRLAGSVGESTIIIIIAPIITRFPIWTRFYQDAKWDYYNIEANLRRRRILFAGFICGAYYYGEYETTAKQSAWCSENWMGGAGCVEGQEKKWMGCCSWMMTSELSASLTSGRLQPTTRGNGAERRNERRNISWRNE